LKAEAKLLDEIDRERISPRVGYKDLWRVFYWQLGTDVNLQLLQADVLGAADVGNSGGES
jgi:hypothetical protein